MNDTQGNKIYSIWRFTTPEKLIELGFIHANDGIHDVYGTDWSIRNPSFHLLIDCWGDVKLARRNPRSDFMELRLNDLFELERLLDWIAEEI